MINHINEMAGCGYVCPQCEGKGFTEEGKECDFCALPDKEKAPDQKAADQEDWIKNVHEGPCCSDQIEN